MKNFSPPQNVFCFFRAETLCENCAVDGIIRILAVNPAYQVIASFRDNAAHNAEIDFSMYMNFSAGFFQKAIHAQRINIPFHLQRIRAELVRYEIIISSPGIKAAEKNELLKIRP